MTPVDNPEERVSTPAKQDLLGAETELKDLPIGNKGDAYAGRAEFNPAEPTLAEGWRVLVEWRRSPEFGVEVTELTLKPTEWVIDGAPAGSTRRRLPDEMPPRGISKAAIDQIKISKIREVIREFRETSAVEYRKAARQLAEAGYDHSRLDLEADELESPVGKSRGTHPKPPSEMADMAAQVLEVIEKGEPLYRTLAGSWGVQQETVQNFWLPKLRRRGYLSGLGQAMEAGPFLVALLDLNPDSEDEEKDSG